MASDVKGTLNTIKSAYTLIGKLPFIKIHQVRIPFNIPWIQMSELDKYGRALDGYMKEFDKAMKSFCVSDPSTACLDTKAKLQSGPFVNSIRENLKRIEEYKRFPTKVLKYITWKERYISQILCNINIIPVSYTHLDVYKRQALTRLDIGETPYCITIPIIWPVSPMSLDAKASCSFSANIPKAWGEAA